MCDSRTDVQELIDFLIVCENVDKNLEGFITRAAEIQQVCADELNVFDQRVKNFKALSREEQTQAITA